MEVVMQQARRSSALMCGGTIGREGVIAGTERRTDVRLENPLGIAADRSVEARRSIPRFRNSDFIRRYCCPRLARTTGKGCPGERSATSLRLLCMTTSAYLVLRRFADRWFGHE